MENSTQSEALIFSLSISSLGLVANVKSLLSAVP